MPSETFRHSAKTGTTSETVWAALQKPETWEAIPGVDRVIDPVVVDGALQGFSFESTAAGKKYLGKAAPARRVEGESMAWYIETTEVRGTIMVNLAPNGDGTQVLVALTVEGVGTLSSMFFPVIAGSIGSGFPKAVDEFAASLG